MRNLCPKYLCPATVISQNRIGPSEYYKLVLNAKNIADNSSPGQFVSIKCGEGPLFRRPFSMASAKNGRIDLIYRVFGKGTLWLSNRKTGNKLDVMGPLGRGFDKEASSSPILVAGGSGIASLSCLAQKLKPGILFYGTKTAKEIICLDYFSGWKIKLATEDGTAGSTGLVTDILSGFLASKKKQLPGRHTLYACGPKNMLKQVSLLSGKFKLPCQISLEEIMACGVGACRGCVVATVQGYRSVCRDGPVFQSKDLTGDTW